MVLINDGAAGGGTDRGDVLVVSGSASSPGAAAGAAGRGGMVLLPDGALPGPAASDGSAVLAGPPPDGPGAGADDHRGDELASAPDGPPRPRPAGND
jgi:hypothetical protein